jgi:hypothetical protein
MAVVSRTSSLGNCQAVVGQAGGCLALPSVQPGGQGRLLALLGEAFISWLSRVHSEPSPADLLQRIIVHEAFSPQGHENSRLHSLLEAAMGSIPGTEACLAQRIPLVAGAEHDKESLCRFAIIDAGSGE